MGNSFVSSWDTYWHPELNPVPYGEPSFDPEFGIGKRKERVMIATEAELRAVKLPKEQWDYCGHTYLEIERCRADNFPFVWRCKDEVAEANACLLDDYILRLKEYERERRLLQRKARLEQQATGA